MRDAESSRADSARRRRRPLALMMIWPASARGPVKMAINRAAARVEWAWLKLKRRRRRRRCLRNRAQERLARELARWPAPPTAVRGGGGGQIDWLPNWTCYCFLSLRLHPAP